MGRIGSALRCAAGWPIMARARRARTFQESPVTPGKKVSRKAPPVTVSPTASPSVRTLILGIDRTGRIVQHDRTAPKILARTADDLLGVHLSDITAAGQRPSGEDVP